MHEEDNRSRGGAALDRIDSVRRWTAVPREDVVQPVWTDDRSLRDTSPRAPRRYRLLDMWPAGPQKIVARLFTAPMNRLRAAVGAAYGTYSASRTRARRYPSHA